VVILVYFSSLGMLYQEKSGNPENKEQFRSNLGKCLEEISMNNV
jgi:hypothetical protein